MFIKTSRYNLALRNRLVQYKNRGAIYTLQTSLEDSHIVYPQRKLFASVNISSNISRGVMRNAVDSGERCRRGR